MPLLHTIISDIAHAVVGRLEGAVSADEVSHMIVAAPSAWGDMALPCFVFAKQIKKSPLEVAQDLASFLPTHISSLVSAKAENGYVNMMLNDGVIAGVINEVLEARDAYGKPHCDVPVTYVVEYASPNTNKPLHLGHMRNIAIGQALISFLRWCGHSVISTEIINDRGIHIMKSIFAYQKWGNGETPKSTGIKGDHFVGNYYVLFSQHAKDDLSLEQEAQTLLQRYEQGDKEIVAVWEQMNQWVLDGIRQTYKRLDVEFDEEDRESEIFEQGKRVVLDGLEKEVFKKRDDGAVYADLTDVGLDTKVVLRADGTAIYMTQDLALAHLRNARHPELDGVLYVVAREQEYHFKVLFELLKRLGFEWGQRCTHVSYGLVNLPTGRMKSREGTVVDADNLLDELAGLASEEIKKRWPDISTEELRSRADMIAQAALRFYLLRVSPQQDMVYNPEESISFDGATGPYLQYTVARTASILSHIEPQKEIDYTILKESHERRLMLLLLQFPFLIRDLHHQLIKEKQYNPSALCQYLYSLAQETNIFYQNHRVLQAETDLLKHARAGLLAAVHRVFVTGLELCNISIPNKM